MDNLEIEIVYALPNQVYQEKLFLKAGSTIQDALLAASFRERYVIASIKVGVFGEEQSFNYVLKPNDRVEIYRPLMQDPKLRRAMKVDKSTLPRRCR